MRNPKRIFFVVVPSLALAVSAGVMADVKGKEPVTYSKQVARIVQEKCQSCHHPGTAAPFSLLTYEDAVNWSASIAEAVKDKRMPPWHADPKHGSFAND